MTELLTLSGVVANIVAVVPLFAAVYKVYLERPIRVRNPAEILNANLQIKNTKPIILNPGESQDVTPDGATFNYTLQVEGNTKEKAIGLLQITHPKNLGYIELNSRGGKEPTKKAADGLVNLDHNNAHIIAEPVDGDANAIDMYGILIHRPAGVPVFPASK